MCHKSNNLWQQVLHFAKEFVVFATPPDTRDILSYLFARRTSRQGIIAPQVPCLSFLQTRISQALPLLLSYWGQQRLEVSFSLYGIFAYRCAFTYYYRQVIAHIAIRFLCWLYLILVRSPRIHGRYLHRAACKSLRTYKVCTQNIVYSVVKERALLNFALAS